MKTIILICIVLSVLEGYQSVPSENLERNRRDTEKQNPPHPPFPSGPTAFQEASRQKRNTPPPGVLIEDLSVKETPKARPILRSRRQTRPVLPGSAGRPQVQPTRPSREFQNQPHITTFVRPQARRNRREAQQAGSAGQPQVQPTRPSREAQNRPELLPFIRPEAQRNRREAQQSGSAGQPQVQPTRPSREAQNRPELLPFIRPEAQRNRRQAGSRVPQTRPSLPGSAGHPPLKPTKYRRDASGSSVNLTRDVSKSVPVNGAPIKLHVNDAPLVVKP